MGFDNRGLKSMRKNNRMMSAVVAISLICVAALGESPQDYQGIAEPVRAVVIRAEVSSELLVDRMAEEGAYLLQSEVLAEQDAQEQAGVVELARLEAENELSIQRAKETIKELELRYEQAETLLSKDAGAEWELRQARVQLELARIDEAIARREQEAARLRQAVEATRLAKFTLRVPFDGQVMKFEADGGAMLAAGDPVAVFADLQQLKIEIYLPVQRYGEMRVGGTYRLMAESPVSERLDAELSWIDPMIDPASQTFRCVFLVDNRQRGLPSGFRAWLPNREEQEEVARPRGPGSESTVRADSSEATNE